MLRIRIMARASRRSKGENRARRQLLRVAIDRVWPGHVTILKICRERIAIELGLPALVGTERLQLRSDQEPAAIFSPVERFDTEPITDQVEHALVPIPKDDGEHADQALDCRRHSPDGGALDDHFGITMSAEAPPGRFELRLELASVIHFAVIGDDKSAAG